LLSLFLIIILLLSLDGALDPKTLYMTKLARKQSTRHTVTLTLKKLASSSKIAFVAIEQYAFFCEKRGLFAGEEAERSATNGRMSAGIYLTHYYASLVVALQFLVLLLNGSCSFFVAEC
jgi:hypothetical protein